MITVIMPAYNTEKFIGEAIQSIIDQTFTDFELIVVDDGSTDGTLAIIQTYVEKDNRVRLIQNAHGGACKARNDAIKEARYDWIASMDADDVAAPNRLERLWQAAQADPEVVVWGSYMHQINVDSKVIGVIQVGPTSKEKFHNLDRTRNPIMVVNPTALFKKEVALQVGLYDERLPAGQDIELWDRMAAHGPVVVIPEYLLKYRLHGSSISASRFFDQRMFIRYVTERYKSRQTGREITMDEFIADYKSKPRWERFTRYLYDRGMYQYRNTGVLLSQGRYLPAAASLVAAVVISPRFAIARILNRFFPRQFP